MPHKLLYEKTYSLTSGSLRDDAAFDANEYNAVITDALRRDREESIFVPRPDREESRRNFIFLAKRFSEKHEISVKITEHEYYISADITINFDSYLCGFAAKLGEIMCLCDEVSFRQASDHNLLISLKHHTKDYYLSGYLIN